MSKQVVLIGGSGHGKVIADLARESGLEVLGFLDDNDQIESLAGLSRLGSCSDWEKILEKHPELRFVFAIGDNSVRENCSKRYPDVPVTTIIHPRAIVAKDADIGEGTVIMAGSIVNPGCRIGCHCILNTRSVLEHDCKMYDFSSLGPGAVTGGNVVIGRQSFVGIGAVILQGVKVGNQSLLGAGGVLIDDLTDNCLSVGVPAKVKRSRESGERYFQECKTKTIGGAVSSMDKDPIESAIRIVLKNNGKSLNVEIETGTKLRHDLGMDSLDLAELTVRLEKETGVDVFAEGIVNTVGEVRDRIGG